MNPPPDVPPLLHAPTAGHSTYHSQGRTLRRLFLTLFLRGRTSRGLRKESAPKSVGSKLALVLAMYALIGLVALGFRNQPVFVLSLYLHGMTMVLLGMFVAASAGEVLFNAEEADILMHRPIEPKALLWAKIGVLVQVSLWLAGAFNLAGFFTGLGASDGGWLFPLAHAISTAALALFCTSCVVITYQLCLRWFGRERLDTLMTTTQVFVAVAAVAGGQLVPRLIGRLGMNINLRANSWWVGLLPPAWFAAFDDAIAGGGARSSWVFGAAGMAMTAAAVWLAFGKLARDYHTGLQTLNEVASPRPKRLARRRWVGLMVRAPLLRWGLRHPVARASFLLTTAYLVRDRDVKLRVYPGLAPFLVMPFVFLIQAPAFGSNFGLVFTSAYLGLIPMSALNLLQYSQQWQAADIFRVAPMAGPAQLCNGARRAVMCFLTLPLLVLFGAVAWWMIRGDVSRGALLLPGLIALPVFALVPGVTGNAVPLSVPTEEAKSAGRGLRLMAAMLVSMAVSGLALGAQAAGLFKWFLLAEIILVAAIYAGLRIRCASVRWPPLE
jgi:ABC-2 type transport system permease protein